MGRLNVGSIQEGTRVGLDTVPFVYFLERHPEFHSTASALFKRIESGEVTAVMSSLVFSELLVPAYRTDDHSRADTIVRLLTSFPNLL